MPDVMEISLSTPTSRASCKKRHQASPDPEAKLEDTVYVGKQYVLSLTRDWGSSGGRDARALVPGCCYTILLINNVIYARYNNNNHHLGYVCSITNAATEYACNLRLP
jgi:hypothetical protein